MNKLLGLSITAVGGSGVGVYLLYLGYGIQTPQFWLMLLFLNLVGIGSCIYGKAQP